MLDNAPGEITFRSMNLPPMPGRQPAELKLEAHNRWVAHSHSGIGRHTAILEVPGGCLVLVSDKRGKTDTPNLCMTFVPNCKVADFGKLQGDGSSDTDDEASDDAQ